MQKNLEPVRITKNPMDKLRQEYQTQIRNSIMVFLSEHFDVAVTDIATIFKVDKGTVSRVINKKTVDKKLIMNLIKFFNQ